MKQFSLRELILSCLLTGALVGLFLCWKRAPAVKPGQHWTITVDQKTGEVVALPTDRSCIVIP